VEAAGIELPPKSCGNSHILENPTQNPTQTTIFDSSLLPLLETWASLSDDAKRSLMALIEALRRGT
jgi:hypothetical protein